MIYVYDAKTFEVKWPLRGEKPINSVAFSPDGSLIAAGGGGLFEAGTIRLYNAATGDPFGSPLRCDSAVPSVAYSADGTKLAAGLGYPSRSVVVFDTQTNEQICSPQDDGEVSSVCFSPDGAKIVSGSWDKKVLIWDAASGEQLCSLKVDSAVLSVAYSPDGTKLTAGLCGPSNSVVVFDTQTNEQIRSLKGHCKDNEECICEFESWGELKTRRDECPVRGHTDVVRSVCFSSDGKQLTSGSYDSTVRNWDPATRASLS
jgi:WD40 repeat protein